MAGYYNKYRKDPKVDYVESTKYSKFSKKRKEINPRINGKDHYFDSDCIYVIIDNGDNIQDIEVGINKEIWKFDNSNDFDRYKRGT